MNDINALIKPLKELYSFNNLCDAVSREQTPVIAAGVFGSAKNHILWGVQQVTDKIVLVVTHSELVAKEIYNDLSYFYDDKELKYFPSKDIIFYNADVRSGEITKQRFNALSSLLKGECRVLVVSDEALSNRLTPRNIFEEYILRYKVGDTVILADITKKLTEMGYSFAHDGVISGAGQYSVRGGILDIATPLDTAFRVEFFGDEIDSIRLLDMKTQRSAENLREAEIYPAADLVCDENTLKSAYKKIQKLYEHRKSILKKEELRNFEYDFRDTLENLPKNLDRFANFLYGDINLLDYLPENSAIFLDELPKIENHMENVLYEFTESIENRVQKGYMLPEQTAIIIPYDKISQNFTKFPTVIFLQNLSEISMPVRDIFTFSIKSAGITRQLSTIFEEVKSISAKNSVVILAGAYSRGEAFHKEMLSAAIPARFISDLTEDTEICKNSVVVSKGSLQSGFSYGDFTLITQKDIFGTQKKKPRKTRSDKGRIESFLDLETGDYVVHDSHGIGVYRGIEKIEVDGIGKDYMRLEYADGGVVYVAANSADSVGKYIGGGEPKVSRLGGADWFKAKQRTTAAIKELAEELVSLYAKRQEEKGYAYGADSVWQKEFEDTFPFEETDDQLRSIEEVKADMELGRVMDRLLCGDVGYGKTEVAIRAAFKAVTDGKQVAYLVPTTILAQQHFKTFTQRMGNFPIRIDLLSRFRTKKEQDESIKLIKKGVSDIVIGTHRILSKDVQFKDLGLIIVDEEQRFGVSHKEKLKRLKTNVDVLTLTATPIPRTLHMSLTGIRDLSLIEEPPEHRRPIQTYVMEYNEEFVRDAIHRELARGGQVYYLHNRVANIDETAARIQALVPAANVVSAHGQMGERDLENIMNEFIAGASNVLVCTTIIETGLDISNANTIIIDNADYYGLSQLYQLRGRVGRSDKTAYAYLMYTKNKILNEIAEKRLQTIKEFTEFGSGFKIAMRDLEIRGAGNLFGAKQHGHMDSVGYELYCRMLDDAVREIKGDNTAKLETTIDIKTDAYIPNFYISNENVKLEIYKKIAAIKTKEDLSEMRDELIDRFGNIPRSVDGLLEIAILKAAANKKGIESILQKGRNIVILFGVETTPEMKVNIMTLLQKYKGTFFYTAKPKEHLTYTYGENVVVKDITAFLDEI
ncbi:transcription-repair-coupling factor [Clostridia bacterium]|nr:transcription-repair-coupling factor [Clostridia bacterium]